MALNLQDAFLSQLKKEGVGVVIFLAKGVQLKGNIKGYDQFTIILEDPEGRIQMVYKHSITTVSPSRQVSEDFMAQAFSATNDRKSGGR